MLISNANTVSAGAAIGSNKVWILLHFGIVAAMASIAAQTAVP